MPSAQPIPTLADQLKAARAALIGETDRYADARTGAIFDHVAGPGALLFVAQAERDQDIFADCYFDDAQGDALTWLIEGRWNIPRILDTYGAGSCVLARSSAAAGAGTITAGTRIQVAGTPPRILQVSADTAAGATALSVAVPVQATILGSGQAVQFAQTGLTLLDPVYDALWTPASVVCADGTDFEPADQYRARARATFLNARNGYLPEIVTVCQNAGAAYVLAFPSNYGLAADNYSDADVDLVVADTTRTVGEFPTTITWSPGAQTIALTTGQRVTIYGSTLNPTINGTWPITVTGSDTFTIPVASSFSSVIYASGTGAWGSVHATSALSDYGLDAIYVADKNYGSSAALVNSCTVALESARVGGCDLWVGGITPTPITLTATVNLIDDPGKLPIAQITRALTQAILTYFGPSDAGYVYRLSAMAGVMARASAYVQLVTITSPASDSTLTPSAWPASLPRYTLAPNAITLNFSGPV